MISFRYHVVSIVAVLLALAAGVVLGSGPLRGQVDQTLANQARDTQTSTAALEAEVLGLRASSRFADDFARTVAPGLLDNTLRGRVVDLVVLPTAQQSDVTALRGFVKVAGGRVGGILRVGGDLVDVGNKQLVDELGTQLEEGASGVRVPADAGPYERIGLLLGRAIGTERKGGARVDSVASTILSAFDEAQLASRAGRLARRADLVLFVAGPGQGDAATRQGSSTVVASLADAVDARTAGVVVAGPVASAGVTGPVRAVRDDVAVARDVSTVDVLGRTAGQVVAVLALAGQAAGQSGQYGAVNAADGAMPAP